MTKEEDDARDMLSGNMGILFEDFSNLDLRAILDHKDFDANTFQVLSLAPDFNDWCFEVYRAIPYNIDILWFEFWMAGFEDTPPDLLAELSRNEVHRIKWFVAGNPCTPVNSLLYLLSDISEPLSEKALCNLKKNHYLFSRPELLLSHLSTLKEKVKLSNNETQKHTLLKGFKKVKEVLDQITKNH